MGKPIWYMAHRLGVAPEERKANIARAKRWLLYLTLKHPDKVVIAPWISVAEMMPETKENREAGLANDLEVVRKCDGIFLAGCSRYNNLTNGMIQEFDALPSINHKYTQDGEPPELRTIVKENVFESAETACRQVFYAMDDMGRDEQRVMLQVAEGIIRGRQTYGHLNVDTDKRDFTKETLEEIRDACVYLCARLVQLENK